VSTLSIPDRHESALKTLLGLKEDVLSTLVSELYRSNHDGSTMSELFETYLPNETASFEAIVSLERLRKQYGLSPADVNDAVAKTFNDLEDTRSIEALLSRKEVQRFAKSTELRAVYENILDDSRIVTDIRPVFDDDEVGKTVDGAFVSHLLVLKYSSDGAGQSIETHIAVDRSDLIKLQKLIKRALEKDAASRTFISEGNATLFDDGGILE
jgi:hypothetical protein